MTATVQRVCLTCRRVATRRYRERKAAATSISPLRHHPSGSPTMWLNYCIRCHRRWATNTNPNGFLYIHKFCPWCIPFISHPLTYDKPSRH